MLNDRNYQDVDQEYLQSIWAEVAPSQSNQKIEPSAKSNIDLHFSTVLETFAEFGCVHTVARSVICVHVGNSPLTRIGKPWKAEAEIWLSSTA